MANKTLERAEELLRLKSEFQNGKKLEWSSQLTGGDWWPVVKGFNWDAAFEFNQEVRLKPEPKLRAWKPEEVPVGALYKGNGWGRFERAIILHTDGNRVWLGSINLPFSLGEMLSDGSHSTDNGATWKPCGVVE